MNVGPVGLVVSLGQVEVVWVRRYQKVSYKLSQYGNRFGWNSLNDT